MQKSSNRQSFWENYYKPIRKGEEFQKTDRNGFEQSTTVKNNGNNCKIKLE